LKSSIEQKIQKEMLALGTSLFAMLKVPVVLFIIILILAPFGSGGASNLWSAVAQDWKTDANTVALVTGVLNGLMGFFGCLAGGLIVDRWGVWVSYFVFGALCALVTFLMALLPMQPLFFIIGFLYTLFVWVYRVLDLPQLYYLPPGKSMPLPNIH
jgi:MFS family permease